MRHDRIEIFRGLVDMGNSLTVNLTNLKRWLRRNKRSVHPFKKWLQTVYRYDPDSDVPLFRYALELDHLYEELIMYPKYIAELQRTGSQKR